MRKRFRIGRSIKNKPLRRVVRVAVGVALLAVGVLGLVLPLLPGWPFLLTGCILLWPRSRVAKRSVRAFGKVREWYRGRAALRGNIHRSGDAGVPAVVTRGSISESEAKG